MCQNNGCKKQPDGCCGKHKPAFSAEQAETLALTLLKDEQGVSETGLRQLYILIDAFNLGYIKRMIDATDGRFYIGDVTKH